MTVKVLESETGSPPHTRGKGGDRWVRIRQTGITPAYAGKRAKIIDKLVKSGDHPRIRGEKAVMVVIFSPNLGSPPHTRGKVRAE